MNNKKNNNPSNSTQRSRSLRRRQVVLGGGALLGTSLALSDQKAVAQNTAVVLRDRKVLRMVTSWPADLPGLGTAAQRFADRVTRMSNKKLVIKVFPAGELVSASQNFDAVTKGEAHLYHSFDSYWQHYSTALNFFSSIPFGMSPSEFNAWIAYGGGQELWDELGEGLGVKPLLAGNIGYQMAGWFRKPADNYKDLKGLKMRVQGIGGEVFQRLGVRAETLNATGTIAALDNKKLDAAEWFGPWLDEHFNFHKSAKYYYGPAFHEPGMAVVVGMNRQVWDDLENDHKELLQIVAEAENHRVLAEFNAKNNQALARLVDKQGVELRKFDDDTLNWLGTEAGKIVAKIGNSSNQAKKIYRSYLSFRSNALARGVHSENAFLKSRLLPFKFAP